MGWLVCNRDVHQLEDTSEMYTLKGKLLDIAYCTFFVFQKACIWPIDQTGVILLYKD